MKPLSIIKAESIGNLTVKLWFNTNEVKTVDVGTFIKNRPHPAYNMYLDEQNFKDFKIESGNIVWGDDWEMIFPVDQLYNEKINL